jgi:acyl dehydratase
MSAAPALYFEDVEAGVEVATPAMTVTATHVALLGGLTGEPLADPGAAQDLLPLILSSGLGWRVAAPPMAVLAFMGCEWRFLLPVRVGDTVRAVTKVAAKRQMKDGGVVIEERRILNQREQVIQSGRTTVLVARRPAPADAVPS